MPNEDNLVIQPNGEVVSHADSQSGVIVLDEENRQKVTQLLRQIPAFLDIAKKLREGKTYQAVFSPEVMKRMYDGSARLDKKDSGLFGVLIRDVETGYITDHVSLKEVPPDLLSSLNELATQQTLADIVGRLEAIDERITDILQGQVSDRLAEVESGILIYGQAVVASDPATRRMLLGNAIQNLNSGRSKLIASADFGSIDRLPRTKMDMRFWYLTHGDIHKYIQSRAEPIWKAAHAIVEASRYLVLAYAALNEPDSFRVSLEQVQNDVKVFQDKMGEMVNRLSPTSNWRESFTTISKGVLPNIHDLEDILQKNIVVEFQPQQIAPPEGL